MDQKFLRECWIKESSLVRLAMNASQGIESAIITIEKLCPLFCSDSADRTSQQISSIWSQALSTLALGNLLKSIGTFGCTVFLLRKFVYYFTNSTYDEDSNEIFNPNNQTLVNQAFAVAIGKVLDAYISSLNTLYASVNLRRSSKTSNGGCLTSIGHSKITLLEVHLHTVGLRTQIEALGNICNLNDIALNFSESSFDSLIVKASSEFINFPRGGNLLTFLYRQLKVSEPVHYALLKFLFIQSFEPYCGFVRSWIFEGQISDPYNECVVEYVDQIAGPGISTSPLATVKVREGVSIPCFLEELLIPFFRAGQQLQVVMKLLEMCNNVATLEEILPSMNISSQCSSLTFDRTTLQNKVHARNSYYQKMLEKVDKIFTMFEFRSHQVCDIATKNISKLDHQDSLIDVALSDQRDQDLVNSDTSSIKDEFELLDSSESSSISGSEEQNESELIIPNYLSALDFSFGFKSEMFNSNKSESCTTYKETEIPKNGEYDIYLTICDLLEKSVSIDEQNFTSSWSQNVHKTEMLNFSDSVNFGSFSNSENYSLDSFSWKRKYEPKFLSMNPILMKRYLFDDSDREKENTCMNSRQPYSDFNFTSVENPLKICIEKSTTITPIQSLQSLNFSVITEAEHIEKKDSCEVKTKDFAKLSYDDDRQLERTGGGGWESLLGRFSEEAAKNVSGQDPSISSVEAFEMPLDFVLKKCLSEDILLQYRFVSKLTIKFLEEGFNLQQHLLALRRYHFMEVADWADLFILTLMQNKWYVSEANTRIPEIHGALELAVQRSSCEGDPNRNRLYPYIKQNTINSLSSSVIGIHSFDFLGLGYRVEWPVNIILTPRALDIYSKIFNFLIQVKLAVFFLTDAWCLLKEIVQLTKKIRHSKLQKQEMNHISVLLETRHEVNHFVCTLQQYVQSQLSHISWTKFLHSLKHKVKDMMDLESVHSTYLNESLHICFLSDETQAVSKIIQNILECAMELRTCLIRSSLDDEYTLSSKLSQVDIHQVVSIKKKFGKNVKDLCLLHLKSSHKHGEFGISSLWNFLNHNDYYSQMVARHALST